MRSERSDEGTGRRRTRPEAGPRPLSARQRAYLGTEEANHKVTGKAPVVPPPGPASASRSASRSRRRVRDAETTHRRVVRRNRKAVNLPPILLRWSLAALAVECVAVALFSPRLNIRAVGVEGNQTVPTPRLLARLGPLLGKNIVRLPIARLRDAALAEPTVEHAEIRRQLPDRVTLVVEERKPWASVMMPDGVCYTIDAKLVPFRKGDAPEKGLPRLRLAAVEGKPLAPVALGKPLFAPGLSEVSKCLLWAKARPDFPLDAVTIDSDGKLCLNRSGGVEVQLGTGAELDEKLASLELLLVRRPDLRAGTDVAYVNLFAYDAPAVMPRPLPSPGATTGGVAPTTSTLP